MTLYDLIYLTNDSATVALYDENQNLIGYYDGKDSLPEEYEFSEVYDIFSGKVLIDGNDIPYIGIEIETESED